MGESFFSAAQLVGFAALSVEMFSWQMKNRDRIFYFKIISLLLWVGHYFLLGAKAGMMMDSFAFVRSVIFYFRTKQKWADNIFWFLLFVSLFLAAGILGWHGPVSIFAILGSLSGTLSFWQKDPRMMRLIGVFGVLNWLPYNFLMGSWAGVAAGLICGSSLLVGIWRFDREFYFAKFFSKKSAS